MEQEKLKKLIDKYLAGKTTTAEEDALFAFYDQLQEPSLDWDADVMGDKSEVKSQLFNTIIKDIKQQEQKNTWAPARWAVAAVFLIGLISVMLFNKPDLPKKEPATGPIAAPVIKNDIPPGSNKATLTLADGSKIALDDIAKGDFVTQSGIKITKAADGQITYIITDAASQNSSVLAYNTIETPKGGQFQINLPDGSRVWLNANSSLRYPTTFAGKVRQVELTGEAYFEVAKNKTLPFWVLSNKQKVEVLGTHFNINAYPDEAEVKTTLLEGSVQVSALGMPAQPRLLNPGQQAIIKDANQPILVKTAETEDAIAWKKGYFIFMNEDLESIMRQLGRWYDVEIEYKGNPENMKFGGMVSRSKSISQALRILELTGNVQFKIEGRRITVML